MTNQQAILVGILAVALLAGAIVSAAPAASAGDATIIVRAEDAVKPGDLVVERPTLICLGFQVKPKPSFSLLGMTSIIR